MSLWRLRRRARTLDFEDWYLDALSAQVGRILLNIGGSPRRMGHTSPAMVTCYCDPREDEIAFRYVVAMIDWSRNPNDAEAKAFVEGLVDSLDLDRRNADAMSPPRRS